jgi:hypothetical protein
MRVNLRLSAFICGLKKILSDSLRLAFYNDLDEVEGEACGVMRQTIIFFSCQGLKLPIFEGF